jgi:hypothetical protein
MKVTRRVLLVGIGAGAAGCWSRSLDAELADVPEPSPEPASALEVTPSPPREGFHAGISLAHIHAADLGYGSEACRRTLEQLAALGVTHVSLTPFAYQPELDGTRLLFGDGLDRSLPDAALVRAAEQARAVGIEVCLKPHIWSDAFWRGEASRQDIDPGSAEGWQRWFEAYTAFAVHYAGVARAMGAALYCVGLEYLKATEENPGAWADVAAACRAVYGGPLTYAANWWREVEAFADWAAFDQIGVNAYYPLSERRDPSLGELVEGWRPHLDALEALSAAAGRPVIFTEAGLRARSGAAARPWDQGLGGDPDPGLQARSYEALLHAASARPWLAGVYWWKEMTAEARDRDPYVMTPQTRAVLQRWWARPAAGGPTISAE